ncbi:MAG: hypothetical protein WKF30_18390 [Pyrinomonadaceae bacterium]
MGVGNAQLSDQFDGGEIAAACRAVAGERTGGVSQGIGGIHDVSHQRVLARLLRLVVMLDHLHDFARHLPVLRDVLADGGVIIAVSLARAKSTLVRKRP